jgi:hypothetical protein
LGVLPSLFDLVQQFMAQSGSTIHFHDRSAVSGLWREGLGVSIRKAIALVTHETWNPSSTDSESRHADELKEEWYHWPVELLEVICQSRRTLMDIQSMVAQLGQEASRIETAIAALVGLGSQPTRRGRPPKRSQAKPLGGQQRRRMSPAARKRISEAMKQRWAKWKGKSAPKKVTPISKKSPARKPMSPAMRKKLSALMKARWAERKAQA